MAYTHTAPRLSTRRPGFNPLKAFAVWRSRQALARLDAAALSDIGLTKRAADAEAAKPIWDVPATWRR